MFKEISITEQKQKPKKNDLITKLGGTAEDFRRSTLHML